MIDFWKFEDYVIKYFAWVDKILCGRREKSNARLHPSGIKEIFDLGVEYACLEKVLRVNCLWIISITIDFWVHKAKVVKYHYLEDFAVIVVARNLNQALSY